MLSLCIPTMDRWEFLSQNLPKYLNNVYIGEIVITDENGNDAKKIRETFTDKKIKVYINEKVLGAFFNKRKSISLASNKYVCLIDSDNFAPVSYFEAFYKFLGKFPPDDNTIYSPSYTFPQHNHEGFDFRVHNGKVIDKHNYKKEFTLDHIVFNLGNFISSKSIHKKLVLTSDEIEKANKALALEAFYYSYLLLTKVDAKIVTVPDMAYHHAVHDGSLYTQTVNITDSDFYKSLYR